jgi:translation elongation factor EF-1beta
MASVAVLFKIYPKEGALEKVLEDVKKLGAAGEQAQDVAFGIKIVKALFKFDDSKDSSSHIESSIKALDCVSEVEVEEEGLI